MYDHMQQLINRADAVLADSERRKLIVYHEEQLKQAKKERDEAIRRYELMKREAARAKPQATRTCATVQGMKTRMVSPEKVDIRLQ